MRLTKFILLIIGAALLLNAIILSFLGSFTAGFIIQSLVAAALILYAVFIDKFQRKTRAAAGIICAVPIIFGAFLGIYGVAGTADFNEDVVFVLGAAISGYEPSSHLAARLDAAVEYHRRNPGAVIVVCGGLGPRNITTEAEAMERYLTARGVPRDKILQENRSTSTYENFKFAIEILENYFPDGFSAVVITNNFHLFRASRTAARLGIRVNRLGAPTPWYTLPMHYFREMLAIANMQARTLLYR